MSPDVQNVFDKDSFLKFMTAFTADLKENSAGWENADLPSFLDALTAWTVDWTFESSLNPWRHAASMLAAAKIYE